MKTPLPAAVIATLLTACAGIGHQSFYANPSAASPFEMCKTLTSAAPDMDFANALRMELGRRGVAEASCPDVIKKRETMVAVGAAAGVVALALTANRHSNVEIGVGTTFGVYGAEAYPSQPAPVADHAWAWDQYRGANGSAIWACRGLPSGALSDPSRCEGKPLSDTTWPGDSPALR
ncbi:hypothetical protein ABT364_07240 [Massilia sp. SR12]